MRKNGKTGPQKKACGSDLWRPQVTDETELWATVERLVTALSGGRPGSPVTAVVERMQEAFESVKVLGDGEKARLQLCFRRSAAGRKGSKGLYTVELGPPSALGTVGVAEDLARLRLLHETVDLKHFSNGRRAGGGQLLARLMCATHRLGDQLLPAPLQVDDTIYVLRAADGCSRGAAPGLYQLLAAGGVGDRCNEDACTLFLGRLRRAFGLRGRQDTALSAWLGQTG